MTRDPVDVVIAIMFGICYGIALLTSAISEGRRRVNRAIRETLPETPGLSVTGKPGDPGKRLPSISRPGEP